MLQLHSSSSSFRYANNAYTRKELWTDSLIHEYGFQSKQWREYGTEKELGSSYKNITKCYKPTFLETQSERLAIRKPANTCNIPPKERNKDRYQTLNTAGHLNSSQYIW